MTPVIRKKRKRRIVMENAKERALQLVNIITSADDFSPETVREAKKELAEHLKILDLETLKDVMERIRSSP